MKVSIVIAGAALLLSACSGVDITPISKAQRERLHEPGSGEAYKSEGGGYVVYEPTLVVSIGPQAANPAICEISAPKTFPNFDRPYLVKSRNGLGKAGVEIKIEDGWRLSSIKDESDNTALLAAVAGLADKKIATESGNNHSIGCTPGIYFWPPSCKDSGVTTSCQWKSVTLAPS